MKITRIIAAGAAALALLAPTAASASTKDILIRLPAEYAADVQPGLANQDFAKLIEERTKGRIKVKYMPNGSAYKGLDLLQANLRGDAEMSTLVSAYWLAIAPKATLFDLPYAFPDVETFDRVASNKAFVSRVYSEAEQKGAKVLGLMIYWFAVPATSKRPLVEPKDFDGVKLRGIGKVNSSSLKALGATPVAINITELMTAMQQGVVDGLNTLWDAHVQYKTYDFVKYATESHLQLFYYPWMVNAKWWNGLDDEDRALVEKAVDDAIANNRKRAVEIQGAAKKEMGAKGVKIHVLTPAEEKKWLDTTAPVWAEYEGTVGKDLVDAFLKVRQK